MESVQLNKVTPYLVIRGQPTIPTWTTPLAALVVAALVMPRSSFLGHLCGLLVGYLCTFPQAYLPFCPDKANID